MTNRINRPVFKKTKQVNNPVFAIPEALDESQISTISRAIKELKEVKFEKNDVFYLNSLGIKLPFSSGAEVFSYINQNNIKIQYAKLSNPNVHACLQHTDVEDVILINSNYKKSATNAEILALSEAIFHECGHSKDKDNDNSIQEELNCLALNVLAHRFYKKKYPNIFDNQTSFLFKEGVNLYEKLFFELDFERTGLKLRVADKYGYLESGDGKHPPSKIAEEIKKMKIEANI